MPIDKLARNLEILREYRLGMTYRELAEKYALTDQRVLAIVHYMQQRESAQEREAAEADRKGPTAPLDEGGEVIA